MVTVAHVVNRLVAERPLLEEMLSKGVVNYAALAEELAPRVEQELGEVPKHAAIMMALRRRADVVGRRAAVERLRLEAADITIRSDLFEVTVPRTLQIDRVKKVYDLTDFAAGDFLTVTHGLHEVTLIASRRNRQRILGVVGAGKVIDDVCAVSIRIPKEAARMPGVFYTLTKTLFWEGVNIIEFVSTLTEATFIVAERDVPRVFAALKALRQG